MNMANRPEGIESLIQGISAELTPEDVADAKEAANRAKEQNASQEMLRFRMFAADSDDQG
jgi:hypothetical protein